MTRSNGFGARRWAGVATVALVVSLAACGGKDFNSAVKPINGPRVLLDSVRTTTATRSARLSMTLSFNGGAANGVGLTVDGLGNFGTGDSELNMQFTGPIAQYFGSGLEMREVDRVGYMKLPDSLKSVLPVPAGAAWVKIPVPGSGAGAGNSAVPGLNQSDPTKMLAYLEAVSNDVHAVGSEPIRGVDTTHYKATLDFGKAVNRSNAPAALRDRLRQLLQSVNGKPPMMPVDVWIDSTGLLRRMEMKIDLDAFAKGVDAGTMDMTMDLYDFGVPVHVEAPPADQVTTLPQFGGASSGAATGAPS